MARFERGGLQLAYDDNPPAGEEAGVILLVHGFAASRAESWKRLGWYPVLARAGYRVIAADLRGHGESDKPHDPAAYARSELAADLVALLDQLAVGRADLLGYSMGAGLALGLAIDHPQRVGNLIVGGLGARSLEARPLGDGGMTLAEAMRAPNAEAIADATLRGFRRFAEQEGADREALAACSEGGGRNLTPAMLAQLATPTLVVAGALDQIAGDPQPLADAIPGAKCVTLPGCDHFTATPHALFKSAVIDFLEGWMDEMPPSP
jgi:pimeloyl-ACP methyl ester carboxylesterase